MEPRLFINCPNCGGSVRLGSLLATAQCGECSFEIEVFAERTNAFDRFRRYTKDVDVIVTDPVLEGNRWVVSSTRLLLV